MRVEIENDKLDLGVTPIENMFINTYLSSANDVQIKVYLYALSNAHSGNYNISNENIAKEMDLTEGQVVDAWNYWISLGIVEITQDKVYRFKSVRYQYIESMNPHLKEDNPTFVESSNFANPQTFEDNSAPKTMIDEIEDFISQGKMTKIKLDAREIKVILELKNEFLLPDEFIIYAYMTASTVRKQKAVDPIVATIRNWVIDGVNDIAKLDLYIENKEKQSKVGNSVNQQSFYPKKTKEKNLFEKDERMSKEEREKFIEEKLKRDLPIPKRNKK